MVPLTTSNQELTRACWPEAYVSFSVNQPNHWLLILSHLIAVICKKN